MKICVKSIYIKQINLPEALESILIQNTIKMSRKIKFLTAPTQRYLEIYKKVLEEGLEV